MTHSDVPTPSRTASPAKLVAADSRESAGDLRAYLKLELSAAFERRLTAGAKLPEAQRQSLTQLVRNKPVTVEAILGDLKLRYREQSE